MPNVRGATVRCFLLACLAAGCGSAPGPKPPSGIPCEVLRSEEGELRRVANCASRAADGAVTVRVEALEGARLGPEGLAAARIGEQWFFVTPRGRTAPACWFDNGTDPFVEGLARTVRRGKVGFVNTDLTEVVPPQWDFAFPFDGGLAVVCAGCVSRPVNPDGEHHEIAGGRWGYIDRAGRVVVAVVHTRESLPGRDAVERR